MAASTTTEESMLKRNRVRLLLIATPILLAVFACAIVLILSGIEPGRPLLAAVAFGAVAVTVLCAWAMVLFARAYRALEAVQQTLLSMLKDSRPSFFPLDTYANLIARIGERLAKQMADLETERDGLKSMLAAMSEGILVVDSRRCVLFSNPAARKILGIPDEKPMGQSLLQSEARKTRSH